MKNKPRILFITPLYPPQVGGPATYAASLVEGLIKRGFKVKVVKFSSVSALPSGFRHLVFFLKIIRHVLWAQVLFAQDVGSVGLPAAWAARLSGRPLIVRVPGDFAWEQSVQRFNVTESIDDFQNNQYCWRVELLRKIEHYIVDTAKIVIVPSDYFKNLVSGWLKDDSKIVRIYNGVETPLLSPCPETMHPLVISAGRMVPWKGFYNLVNLVEKDTRLQLHIYGDGPEKEQIQALICSKNLTKRVILKGSVDRSELLSAIQASGLFVLLSSFESFSFQIVEAMMVGAVVIAYDIGNLSEIIDSGENGFLFPLGAEKAVLEKIQWLIDDEQQMEIIGNKARIHANKFSVENMFEQLVKVIGNYD